MTPLNRRPVSLAMAVAAMGVVFGDVGTSPLYAFRAVFTVSDLDPGSLENVLGVLSLIFWSITLVVGIKYVAIVLRADNEGEGGVLALMQLVTSTVARRWSPAVMALGLAGCALFFGDGVITPAISVLSAVEGLELVAPGLEPVVLPLAVAILLGLFLLQRRGTGAIGRLFGPVMVVWFTTLAVLGLLSILQHPGVLAAINPAHALVLLGGHPVVALTIFGTALLCVTGGEALYADLGHFGRRAISRAWYLAVYPALLLNYFGQGALLLRDATALKNPFYRLMPAEFLLPFVVLATLATVIASQAVISGVFSITRQCLQVDLLPRMRVVQSSAEAAGQVYVPFVNWTLCVLTIALAIGFGSSDALAGAYGVGVSITMLIDSVLMIALLAATRRAGWRWMVPVLGVIMLLEVMFVTGNLQKIPSGGWFPLVFGLIVLWLLQTWREGRESLHRLTQREDCPLPEFRQLVERLQPTVIGGTAVYLSSNPADLPRTLVRNLRTNRVMHALTIVMTVDVAPVPHVLVGSRCRITELMPGLVRVQSRVGFMDPIDVPQMMREVQKVYREIVPPEVRYVIGRDDITTTGRSRMSAPQKAVFAFMSRNAEFAGGHLGIPAHMILESGAQVEL